MPPNPFPRRVLFCALAMTLAACATSPREADTAKAPRQFPNDARSGVSPALADAAARAQGNEPTDRTKIYKGSGVVVKGELPGGMVPPIAQPQVSGGGIVLNFEDADLREVIRNILGDILNEGYTIDQAVGGRVTIRTSSGIPREALPSTLETLLRMNGATMVREGGIWKIVPQAAAVRGNLTPQLGGTQRALPPGYSVQIVPLRFVGVREMQRILEPFARDAAAVRADEVRNLMILAGTEVELKHLLDAIEMFDIDWMSGMSAGVFTLQNADIKSVTAELDKIIGDRNLSPLTGILRIIPIERMNALLVISPNPHYIDEAKKWIDRLDAGTGEGVRFYVFNLQNQRAEHVGPLLQQAFTGRVTQQATTAPPSVAPGTPAGQIISPPSFMSQPNPPGTTPPTTAATAAGAAAGAATGAITAARALTGEGVGVVRNIQVVADKDQNTILIVATPSEYSVIEQALRKLDVPARQVMIEVTIAQVQLNDTLQFGIDWLFKGGAPSGRGSGGNFTGAGTSPFNPAVPLAAVAAGASAPALALATGFNYIINNANFPGGVQAVLNLLDTYGDTKVIANPHVAALDNQKATIKSGLRIPVNQTTNVGGTTNAFVTTTASYIDTGVLLQVTPHINAGGLVTLDVQAESSTPGPPATAGDAPPINTQSVQTLISVPSGKTMVMGGLIQETKGNTTNGLPLVDRIPILGGLFGTQKLQNDRTELVLFITPRVVGSDTEVEAVINDLRRRMEMLDRVFPGTSTWPAAPPSAIDRLNELFTPRSGPIPPPPSDVGPKAPPAGQPSVIPAIPPASMPAPVPAPDSKPGPALLPAPSTVPSPVVVPAPGRTPAPAPAPATAPAPPPAAS